MRALPQAAHAGAAGPGPHLLQWKMFGCVQAPPGPDLCVYGIHFLLPLSMSAAAKTFVPAVSSDCAPQTAEMEAEIARLFGTMPQGDRLLIYDATHQRKVADLVVPKGPAFRYPRPRFQRAGRELAKVRQFMKARCATTERRVTAAPVMGSERRPAAGRDQGRRELHALYRGVFNAVVRGRGVYARITDIAVRCSELTSRRSAPALGRCPLSGHNGSF